MQQSPEGQRSDGLIWGLQKRLLAFLFLPLALVGLVSVYFHYSSAGTAALQQDQQLKRLVPLLADSVVVTLPNETVEATGLQPDPGIALLLAPSLDGFLKDKEGAVGYGVMNSSGRLLVGDNWLPTVLPTTEDPEFLSHVEGGITYRVVAQRSATAAGELILMLADGSDARQQWLDSVFKRVVLPNLFLMLVVAATVTWAVTRALRPLIDLTQAVEGRSPSDLSPIAAERAPLEVRPLVASLNRLFALVNEQTSAQRRFVADAAHQLRTPLAGLQSQVEAWAQTVDPQDASAAITLRAEQVLRLRDASRRTAQLANQLLALSRADSLGTDAQPIELVDLKALCESILALYLDAAAEKCMDLGIECAPAQTRGHAWLLRELLVNAVDNAIKHVPTGGRVTLRCGEDLEIQPPTAWIEVEDDGPGITAEECPRVLERFYRLKGTQAEGSGLGLAIASEIARVHHTQVQLLQPQQGRGLLFRVEFEAVSGDLGRVRESVGA